MGIPLSKVKQSTLNVLNDLGNNVPVYDLIYIYIVDQENHPLTTKCIRKYNITKLKKDCMGKCKICSFDCIYYGICEIFTSGQHSRKPNLIFEKTKWHIPIRNELFLPEFSVEKSFTTKLRVLEEISRGAFGKAYKVNDMNTGAVYAVKTLLKSDIILVDMLHQLKDEVRIHKACGHHQFIVNCLYTWQSKLSVLIVSDYQKNGDLFDLLETYVLTETLARLYIAEISIVFDFLHNAGVIYRDLKPENILLDEQYHICLTDFGLSKWLSKGSRTNTICGTGLYMAPEIVGGSYTHAVDWWSLGILAYRMLTEQYPQRVQEVVILPDTIVQNIPVADLLIRLLTHDPTKRLHSLYTLKTIAFYKNYNFKSVSKKKINATELLQQCQLREVTEDHDIFVDFDTSL